LKKDGDSGGGGDEPVDHLDGLVQGYKSSLEFQLMYEELKNLQHDEQPHKKEFYEHIHQGSYASSFWTQVRENVRRSFISTFVRRRTETVFLIVENIFLGIFLCTLFFNIGTDQEGVRNRVSLIFFSTNFAGFIGFSQIAPVMESRAVFYHEQAAGSYRPIAYGIAICLCSIPVAFLAVFAYSLPAYWIADLDPRHDFDRFLFFIFVYFLTSLVFIALSVFLAVALPSEGVALMVLGISLPIFLLFGGFLIPRDQLPDWWVWAYWITPIHYPVEAMTLNTISGLAYHCTPDQAIPLVNADGSIFSYCPITSSSQIFADYGYLEYWKWIDLAVLGGGYLIFVGLTLLALTKIRWVKM